MKGTKIIIVNSNPQFELVYKRLKAKYDVSYIDDKKALTLDNIKEIDPDWIFFTHWSCIVSNEIHEQFTSVVFHMTDLPYGRGGSPLQNLIVRGNKETKLSAIRMTQQLDAGDIYLKENLSLEGTAREIFQRAADLMINMIPQIVENNIYPQPQDGEIVTFKRRKPEDGNMHSLITLQQVYDHIRMLDADNYPQAFIELDNFKVEFYNAKMNGREVLANVRIIKK